MCYCLEVSSGANVLLTSPRLPLQNKNPVGFFRILNVISLDMGSYCDECFFMLSLRFSWHTSPKCPLNQQVKIAMFVGEL
jgi:hypothetical protein